MREKRRDGDRLRTVLTSMIVDDEVLTAVVPKWPEHGGLFDSPWANLIGGWAVDHFREFKRAPRRSIEQAFSDWADGKAEHEQATVRNVDGFLTHLSRDYDRSDRMEADHVIRLAESYFDGVLVKQAMEQAEDLRATGKADDARALLKGLEPFRLNGRAEPVVKLSTVERRKVSWLWRSRLPWGQLAIIDGDMGCGKTQIALDIAARVTRNWQMPPGGRTRHRRDNRTPGNVLILSSEDDAASTIGPRFDAAGGDPDRAWVLTPDAEGKAPMTFPQSYPDLLRLIERREIRLVVIDPFYGFLDGKVDSNTDHKVRAAMRRLSEIAQATGCAILLIRHLNKKSGENPLYRGGGSVGVAAACPAALIIGRDPENRDVRVLAANRIKHAAMGASLAYAIEGHEHPEAGATSRIEWLGESELTAFDVLEPPKKKQGRPSQQEEMAAFIRGLFDKRKTVPSTELEEAAVERFGCSKPTYLAACKKAGVERAKEGLWGRWTCRLADPEE